MIKVKILTPYKSFTSISEFQIPKFTVLTGKNGSGKTHLLEVISKSSNSEVSIDGKLIHVKEIKYIGFNGLNPAIQVSFDQQQITEFINNAWREYYTAKHESNPLTIDVLLTYAGNNEKLKSYFKKVYTEAGKDINNFTEGDFTRHFDPAFFGPEDFLFVQLAHIFKQYQRKAEENSINEYFFKVKGMQNKLFLDKEAFEKKFGTPPWTFVNQLLQDMDLPYEVNNPEVLANDEPFFLRLKDKRTNLEIYPSDLSTGEKVLMSLATVLYNAEKNGFKPQLILLDEPDAGLHPSMSRKMVDILVNRIVKQNNISCVITTHSPTTLIFCEGNSIFNIEKGKSEPVKASIQEAVDTLTGEIPFLKISTEKRRQVFVESKYDVINYEHLTNIYSRLYKFSFEPIFIPASTSNGSNCTDVQRMVNSLFENGNDQVYGIIDRDADNKSEQRIIVLGDGNRYAIENYLLDPLISGLFLLREKNYKFSNTHLNDFTSYIQAEKLTATLAQEIIDEVLQKLNLDESEIVDYELQNGWTLKVSKKFCEMNGHKLEELYKKTFTSLQSFHQEGELKKQIILKVINDFPGYAPNDIVATLLKIK